MFNKRSRNFALIKIKIRMKTSISSTAFCSITDRQTDKIFTEYMLIYEGNLHTKKFERYLNYLKKITFPTKRG